MHALLQCFNRAIALGGDLVLEVENVLAQAAFFTCSLGNIVLKAMLLLLRGGLAALALEPFHQADPGRMTAVVEDDLRRGMVTGLGRRQDLLPQGVTQAVKEFAGDIGLGLGDQVIAAGDSGRARSGASGSGGG